MKPDSFCVGFLIKLLLSIEKQLIKFGFFIELNINNYLLMDYYFDNNWIDNFELNIEN